MDTDKIRTKYGQNTDKETIKISVSQDRIFYLTSQFDLSRCHLLDAITDLVIKDISDKKHQRAILEYCQERALEMYKYFNELEQLIESGVEEGGDEG